MTIIFAHLTATVIVLQENQNIKCAILQADRLTFTSVRPRKTSYYCKDKALLTSCASDGHIVGCDVSLLFFIAAFVYWVLSSSEAGSCCLCESEEKEETEMKSSLPNMMEKPTQIRNARGQNSSSWSDSDQFDNMQHELSSEEKKWWQIDRSNHNNNLTVSKSSLTDMKIRSHVNLNWNAKS